MLYLERQNKILRLLDENMSVSVNDLVQKLKVSSVTVRKMLGAMARQGLLQRTRGGAVSYAMSFRELSFLDKTNTNVSEKKAIAKVAYAMINDQETIYLDAGTTTHELVRLIKNGKKRNLVVVTDAMNIASELLYAHDINLILSGGELRPGVISCVGPIAEQALEALHFDKTFLGANNVSLKFGASTPNLLEARMKICAIKNSEKTYLLCDSSKFAGASMAKICPLDTFNAIITDNHLETKIRSEFKKAKIKLIIAD
ncbi:DeoR family transcriptional regulator [Spirochaetia bacterium]|nr:DeoR family transcriptional regulator [Spirochaetia bacterium]